MFVFGKPTGEGIAPRSRTGRPGTPHSSRLARLAPRPSAAAGIDETDSRSSGDPVTRYPACCVSVGFCDLVVQGLDFRRLMR